MSKIKINCDNCGEPFLRVEKEVRRSQNLGRKNFCSRTCAGKVLYSNFGDKRNTDTSHLHGLNKDEFTGFRWYLRKSKQRFKECNLDLQYIKDLFEKQKGICVYSKVKLQHPKYNSANNHIHSASLDRIDSSKGYIKGNVQFISIAMNHMKSNMTHKQTLELIDIIKKLK